MDVTDKILSTRFVSKVFVRLKVLSDALLDHHPTRLTSASDEYQSHQQLIIQNKLIQIF